MPQHGPLSPCDVPVKLGSNHLAYKLYLKLPCGPVRGWGGGSLPRQAFLNFILGADIRMTNTFASIMLSSHIRLPMEISGDMWRLLRSTTCVYIADRR